MLKLSKITKKYKMISADQIVINGISITFRKNEFASILGPSGSGKTTLLNIIGGLDEYTSGDLIIDGKSTKNYTDSDWDSYRNHKIGFVFQNYNLIPHQTVLQNVMLALTLSGVSKRECIAKSEKILKEVGLADHIHKKPGQLSGGQMQRVAIARALVNDPEIILADEPTGALDTETSIQIMKILKKISKNKLVIMVTHNPELAKEYSTRIINLKDGKIISDTNEYDINSKSVLNPYENIKKTTMKYITALGLSFNNLMTKKGRTLLVSFAGSIGIIGIALILSLSNGFQKYIDKIQEDTLSSYPLTITSTSADMSSLLLSMISTDDETTNNSKVTEKQFISSMFSNVTTNDLKSFKKHINQNYSKISSDISSIKYSYSVDPLIYTRTKENKIVKVNPNSLFTSMYDSSSVTNLYSSYSSFFSQMPDDRKMLNEQYEVLNGKWPEKYDEMVIVLNQKNTIPDILLYFLGIRDIEELYDIMAKAMAGDKIDVDNKPMEFTYDELMQIEIKLINQFEVYKYNEKYNIYENMTENEDYMKKLYDNALKLKIVGIIAPKKGTTSMALTSGISYSSKLIDYIIDSAEKSDIVKKQLSNKDIDVFSNTNFDEKKTNSQKIDFEDLITVDTKMLQSAFNINVDEKNLKIKTSKYMQNINDFINVNIEPAQNEFNKNLSELSYGVINDYLEHPLSTISNPILPDKKIATISMNDIDKILNEYFEKKSVNDKIKIIENEYVIPKDVYITTYKSLITAMLKSYITAYYAMDQSLTTDPNNPIAMLMSENVKDLIESFLNQPSIQSTSKTFGENMTEAKMQKNVLTEVGKLTNDLMSSLSSGFNVDESKIAKAFKFNLSEEELKRIMSAMVNQNKNGTATVNLASLGYQDKEEPTMISVYFKNFDSKERFLNFIDTYNKECKNTKEEEKIINYIDMTGILMNSVKKIINSVGYVLIAFVSISLVVSSIMIGIITYISVLERTKEIGILRSIGASKKNISSIFNAETFIIGLLSGIMGIGITLSLIPIINSVIHSLTNNVNINASLPLLGGVLLIILSVILTLIGGLIPAKKASKQDPVIALRTE